MSNVVDLTAIIAERTEPDADCQSRDRLTMRRLFEYSYDYKHDGRTYTLSVMAYDEEDAEARIESMKQTITYGGQIYAKGTCDW